VELQAEQKMQDWKHERCGAVLTVPYDGVKNIKCDGCETIISVPKYGTKPAANHTTRKRANRSTPSQNWGGLRPQTVEKKPKYDSVFSSEIVKVGKTLTKHLNSGKSLKAVVYVSSPIEILRVLDDNPGMDFELVMGHQRVHDFKSELTPDVVEKLIDYRNTGRLRLFVSDKVHYHSKLYICEFENSVKLINGSANLTKTGTGIKGTQWNHIWIVEITGDYHESDDYQTELDHYETYKSKTSEFFGDFAEAFEQVPEEKRIKVIENWIASGDVYGLPEDAQVQKVTRLVIDEVMSPDVEPNQTVVTILPEASKTAVSKFQTNYSAFGVTIESEGQITVPVASYLNHTNRDFPIMVANAKSKSVQIGWGGKNLSRTAKEYDRNVIDKSLQQFEEFIHSVDFAEPEFPTLAKTSVAEAALYILSSPFHHMYMKQRRKIFGITEERGPRILHLYGGTSNGKSKLLTYCSLLLTGKEIVQPLDGDMFSDSRVTGLRSWQSVFPMMWDDLTNDKWSQQAEKVIKTHWDKRWTEDEYCPQIILTSNRQCPRGPLQTRVKEIHLSTTYQRTTESRVALAGHLKTKNQLFEYFSKAYFEKFDELEYDDDEAYIARESIRKLYKVCGRKIPSWMPLEKPLEESYKPTAVQLLKAIVDGSCSIKNTTDEIVLEFDENFQWFELKPYLDGIPNEFEMDKKGKKVFIRRPDRFKPWLRDAIPWIGKRKIPRKIKRLIR
jgi:hypothetical protein